MYRARSSTCGVWDDSSNSTHSARRGCPSQDLLQRRRRLVKAPRDEQRRHVDRAQPILRLPVLDRGADVEHDLVSGGRSLRAAGGSCPSNPFHRFAGAAFFEHRQERAANHAVERRLARRVLCRGGEHLIERGRAAARRGRLNDPDQRVDSSARSTSTHFPLTEQPPPTTTATTGYLTARMSIGRISGSAPRAVPGRPMRAPWGSRR